jgi:hypothetical protein
MLYFHCFYIPTKEFHHTMLNGLDYLLAALAASAAGAANALVGHTNQLPIGSQIPTTHV